MPVKIYQRSLKTGGRDDWETPPWLFSALNKELGKFTLDAAASEANTLCPTFFSEGNSALDNQWRGTVFCNPPYSLLLEFCREAYLQERAVERIVFLIPARVDTQAWHNFIFGKAAKVWFIEGRLKMYLDGLEAKDPAGFPSAIIEWSKNSPTTRYKTITKEIITKWKRQYSNVVQ